MTYSTVRCVDCISYFTEKSVLTTFLNIFFFMRFPLFLHPISLLCLCVFCVSLPNFKECLSENKITTHHYHTWSKTVLSYFRVLLLVCLTPLSHFNVLRCFKEKEKIGYESSMMCKYRSKTYFRVLLYKVCL